MSQELLYTSAPRGLKPGSRGFCTVLSTQGMAAPLATALEGLSGYRPVFPTGDPRAGRNPIVYSHVKLQSGGRTWNVLSRIADFGLDYSQRSNKLAHHVVLDRSELQAGGPANLLSTPDFIRTDWDGEPQLVASRPPVRESRPRTGICVAWQEMTGDAGWAGVLAESFLHDPDRLVILLFAPGQDLLPLFAESISLLPPERRWEVTFSTYFTGLAAGTTCVWRGMVKDSKEAHDSLRFVDALRLDITEAQLGAAAGGVLVEAARLGNQTHRSDTDNRHSERDDESIHSPVEQTDSGRSQSSEVHFAAVKHDSGVIRLSQSPPRPPRLSQSRRDPAETHKGRSFHAWALLLVIALIILIALPAAYHFAGIYITFVDPSQQGVTDRSSQEKYDAVRSNVTPSSKSNNDDITASPPRRHLLTANSNHTSSNAVSGDTQPQSIDSNSVISPSSQTISPITPPHASAVDDTTPDNATIQPAPTSPISAPPITFVDLPETYEQGITLLAPNGDIKNVRVRIQIPDWVPYTTDTRVTPPSGQPIHRILTESTGGEHVGSIATFTDNKSNATRFKLKQTQEGGLKWIGWCRVIIGWGDGSDLNTTIVALCRFPLDAAERRLKKATLDVDWNLPAGAHVTKDLRPKVILNGLRLSLNGASVEIIPTNRTPSSDWSIPLPDLESALYSQLPGSEKFAGKHLTLKLAAAPNGKPLISVRLFGRTAFVKAMRESLFDRLNIQKSALNAKRTPAIDALLKNIESHCGNVKLTIEGASSGSTKRGTGIADEISKARLEAERGGNKAIIATLKEIEDIVNNVTSIELTAEAVRKIDVAFENVTIDMAHVSYKAVVKGQDESPAGDEIDIVKFGADVLGSTTPDDAKTDFGGDK